MKTSKFHESVLLEESIDLLQVKRGEKYIDATLGGGGHAAEIINRSGIVLGLDIDQEAHNYVEDNLKSQISSLKLKLVKANFRNIDKIADKEGFNKVSGIIYDLGVSSFQLEDETRGFSFQKEADLDMRMNSSDSSGQVKASDILNLARGDELYEIFTKLGEERRARAISDSIVRTRKVKAIGTTGDLLKIIEGVYGIRGAISEKTRAAIAKRVFQALRITVNDELKSLEETLPKALRLLKNRGRVVVISFHSLEDRIVKRSFLEFEKIGEGRIVTKKPILPSWEEIRKNKRSRSAKMRVLERIYE